jgi:hypothetical protein
MSLETIVFDLLQQLMLKGENITYVAQQRALETYDTAPPTSPLTIRVGNDDAIGTITSLASIQEVWRIEYSPFDHVYHWQHNIPTSVHFSVADAEKLDLVKTDEGWDLIYRL